MIFSAHRFAPFLALTLVVLTAQADSLWTSPGSAERSIFADRKAAAKGDIVSIIVQENSTASSSARKKADRTSSINSSITQFLLPQSITGIKPGKLPSTTLSSANTFSGGGDISNTQSLTATAAVLVTDVLPNGNLVVQGVRIVTFSGETQYAVLHGIIRPDDISASNTIPSTSVADARVEFISEGNLTDAQKRGFLTQIYDILRPY